MNLRFTHLEFWRATLLSMPAPPPKKYIDENVSHIYTIANKPSFIQINAHIPINAHPPWFENKTHDHGTLFNQLKTTIISVHLPVISGDIVINVQGVY